MASDGRSELRRTGARSSAGLAATVATATKTAAARLASGGIPDASVDARRLVCHILGTSPARLIAEPDRSLTDHEVAALDTALARRLAREPISRIEGRREFFGRTFIVTPDVLDPRPDTETVVEAALEILAIGTSGETRRILDIGTGSGAILLTLLAECAGATGTGLDISLAALSVARANAAALGLAHRATFAIADLTVGLPSGFDVWISNPPYIATAEIDVLDKEVRNFDPLVALDGGADGLAAYRAILSAAAGTPDATLPRWIVLEAGAGQSDAIVKMADDVFSRRLCAVQTRVDLGGHTRCVALALQRQST